MRGGADTASGPLTELQAEIDRLEAGLGTMQESELEFLERLTCSLDRAREEQASPPPRPRSPFIQGS